jgi:hypothetical protein
MELARRGVVALGVDASPEAVEIGWKRGLSVLRRSVFERLPGMGRWGTAILMDGNIGIGGHPTELLCRLREVLRPEGRVLIEVDRPGQSAGRRWLRLELGGEVTPAFPWSRVGADRLGALAEETGFAVSELWSEDGRWFGVLDRR